MEFAASVHKDGRRPFAAKLRSSQTGTPLAAHLNGIAARLLRRDLAFAVTGLYMAELMSPLDHSKAERKFGWEPQPVEHSIREAAKFFVTQRR
jgi:hypothetical protein